MAGEVDISAKAVVQNARIAMLLQHIRQNNISYMIGTFVLWQMGALDSVVTYGSGICS